MLKTTTLTILLLTMAAQVSYSQVQNSSVLALGDSYTIGEGVEKGERWPMQLVSLLAAEDSLLAAEDTALAEPDIVATSGWTTEELLSGISEAAPKGNRDMVTLLIGVNNQYRGQKIDVYRSEFEQLLRRAIRFANNNPQRVIVVSIPDYGITPFIEKRPEREPAKIARELDEFNAAAKEIASRHNTHWVDITPISRRVGSKSEMLAPDGLHPSGKMYSLWAKEIFPIARKILAKR